MDLLKQGQNYNIKFGIIDEKLCAKIDDSFMIRKLKLSVHIRILIAFRHVLR